MYKVTLLKDIACQVGCSVNTVSLALKDSPRISEKTRKRIQSLAKELNYVSNNMARALVLNKTGIAGLIIKDISSMLLTSEARYIDQYLEQAGYTMYMVASHSDSTIEKNVINLMLANRLDGLIVNIATAKNIPKLEELRAQGLPIVLLSGFETAPAIDSVYPDLIKAAYMVTKHLFSMGHKRVVFVVEDRIGDYSNTLKLCGFKRALAEEGISFEDDMIFPVKLYNSGTLDPEALPPLIHRAKKETAFFVSHDELAITLIKQLSKNGIRVPGDISIASIDNIRFSESCMVALTTVGFDLQYISHRAVELLINIIEGKNEEGVFQNIKVEPDFFVRESCGYLR
jgi:DNA-binding LacI/PurR family transcriptional regulator